MKKVKVGNSKIHGKGLFTQEPIKKGELILPVHSGINISQDMTRFVPNQYGKFYNHDEKNFNTSNEIIGDKRYLRAIKNIPAGSELTANYREHPEMEQPEDFGKGKYASFDFDKTIATPEGLAMAKKMFKAGYNLFIVSARDKVTPDMIARARQAGIPPENIIATGSDEAKVRKVKQLGVEKHFDDKPEVISQLGSVGQQFKKGGGLNSMKYTKSIFGKNKLFVKNKLFKTKKVKNRIYDPNAKYYEDGGSIDDYMIIDIPEEQIQEYVNGGYIVEELPGYNNGGVTEQNNQVECDDDGRCYETDQIQNMLDRGRDIPREVLNTAWDVINQVYPEKGKGISAVTAWKNRGVPTLASRLGMTDPSNCMWAAGSGWMCEPEFKNVPKTAFESNDKFINAVNKGTIPFTRVTKTTDPYFDFKSKGLLQPGDIINLKGPNTSHAMTFSHYREDGMPIYVDSNGKATDFDWDEGIWPGIKPGNGRTAYVSRFNPEMLFGDKIKELEEKARTNPTYYTTDDQTALPTGYSFGGIFKKRKSQEQEQPEYVEPVKIQDEMYESVTPWDKAPEDFKKGVGNINEVTATAQAPDWLKFSRDYEKKNSRQAFIDQKKREYLKNTNKGLGRLAGNSMENFPEDVERRFGEAYDYKKNSYIVKNLGKKEKFSPNRRGEWIDNLSEKERDIVANSRYESKLQPGLWDRTVAGLTTLATNKYVTPLLAPIANKAMNEGMLPGLTKKEQREIKDSKLFGIPTGGLEALAGFDLPGVIAANALEKSGSGGYGAGYRESPGVLSGQPMANVTPEQIATLNLANYLTPYEAVASLPGLARNAKNVASGIKNVASGIKNITSGKIDDLSKFVNQSKSVNKADNVDVFSKYSEDLPQNLIERRREELTSSNPRKKIFNSEEEVEKALKIDKYRIDKLKKQYPDLDFNDPSIKGHMFTDKDDIEKIPGILKSIKQNKKSGESFAKYLKKDFDTKMDFVKNSNNKVLMNVVEESPQYLDEVYDHLKKPGVSDEDFLNELTVRSNTYARFMKDDIKDVQSLNELRGKNIDNSGFSMDVEGMYPSDAYGNYGYRIEPNLERLMEIFSAPLEEKWSKRIPNFQSDIKMVPGMWTGLPEKVKDAIKLRNQRIDRNLVNSYAGARMENQIPMEAYFRNTIEQNLPQEFVKSKYFTVPQHQVFNSQTYGAPLEGFQTIRVGELNIPENYTGFRNNPDYQRFFQGTGKGFEEGGEFNYELGDKVDEATKIYLESLGYTFEEV